MSPVDAAGRLQALTPAISMRAGLPRRLMPMERDRLEGCFDRATLDGARIVRVAALRFPAAACAVASWIGYPSPAVREFQAVAFGRLIVIATAGIGEAIPIGLLIHELIHLVQYEVLGFWGFLRSYLAAFKREGSYQQIPHERLAYALEDLMRRYPEMHAPIRPMIERWASRFLP